MESYVSIKGVDELVECIQKGLEKCPDEMNAATRKISNSWKKDVNSKFPSADYGSQGGKIDPIAKRWKTQFDYGDRGYIVEAKVGSSHPLFHLLENGHEKWLFGKNTGGFVPGKHFKDSVNEQYETEYPEKLGDAAKKALEEAGF